MITCQDMCSVKIWELHAARLKFHDSPQLSAGDHRKWIELLYMCRCLLSRHFGCESFWCGRRVDFQIGNYSRTKFFLFPFVRMNLQHLKFLFINSRDPLRKLWQHFSGMLERNLIVWELRKMAHELDIVVFRFNIRYCGFLAAKVF